MCFFFYYINVMNTELLLIDFQNDFCSPQGSLYVPNAEKDCANTADFIYKNIDKIHGITITLDTHPFYHIAHPIFWKCKDGSTPEIYTQITLEKFSQGEYIPVDEKLYDKVKSYLTQLENSGKYTLILWPPHCLQATWGSCIQQDIWEAVHKWECLIPGRRVNYVTKALNPLTEHYSAIQAEVPDPQDPNTTTNYSLVEHLKSKAIYVAGEALSHCVANTVSDLVSYILAENITLLSDCSSNVQGFEEQGNNFLNRLSQKGMKIIKSKNFTL